MPNDVFDPIRAKKLPLRLPKPFFVILPSTIEIYTCVLSSLEHCQPSTISSHITSDLERSKAIGVDSVNTVFSHSRFVQTRTTCGHGCRRCRNRFSCGGWTNGIKSKNLCQPKLCIYTIFSFTRFMMNLLKFSLHAWTTTRSTSKMEGFWSFCWGIGKRYTIMAFLYSADLHVDIWSNGLYIKYYACLFNNIYLAYIDHFIFTTHDCDITFFTVFILTRPVNFPCGRELEHPEKTHDFPQSVDWFFSHESVSQLRWKALALTTVLPKSHGKPEQTRRKSGSVLGNSQQLQLYICTLFSEDHSSGLIYPHGETFSSGRLELYSFSSILKLEEYLQTFSFSHFHFLPARYN